VVIVVIGILASITIVSYTGITARANTTQALSNAQSVQSYAEVFNVDNGRYPDQTASFSYGKSVKFPPNITLLTGAQTLSTNKSPSEILWKYDGAIGASTGGTIQYWDSAANSVATNTVKVGTGIGTTEPAAVWISGLASTVMSGKYVYSTDLGSTYQWKADYTFCVGPQCVLGFDPINPSAMALISPQTNTSVDFSAYTAQNACRALGGRLPNMQELTAIYNGRASYGNNFQSNKYMTATEFSQWSIWSINFADGSTPYTDKPTLNYVRCVAGG
jgi:type II secretory pathway pseudopilin PulG